MRHLCIISGQSASDYCLSADAPTSRRQKNITLWQLISGKLSNTANLSPYWHGNC
jgi:hypothetical protein